MFTLKHYINIISSFIIGLISLIYVYNYSLIYSQSSFGIIRSPLLFISIYLFLFFFVIFSFDKAKFAFAVKTNKYFFALIILILLVLFYYIIDIYRPALESPQIPGKSRVFELSTITSWLHNFYHGIFPYQLSHSFSSFPFLYIMVSPFYWLGEIAFAEVFAWGILGFLIIYNSGSLREKIIKLFLLLISPLTFYSLFELPLIFLESVILVFLIYLSNRYLNPVKVDKYFILFAALFGLFFSVKVYVVIPVIIYILFLFRNNIKEGFLFCETLLALFLVTVIPFILWNPGLFFFNGPMMSLFMFGIPWWGIVIFLVITIYIGWMISDLQEVFFAAGILLMIFALINFFIEPFGGLSNFVFALPFLIFSIKDYRIEKFAGKILENEI